MVNPTSGGAARRGWSAVVLLRRPRLWEGLLRLRLLLRHVARRASATAAGAALVVTLGSSQPRAEPIHVIDGEVAVLADGLCSLIEAIHNANDTTTGAPYADCAPGDPAGADEIVLPADGFFILTAADNETYGPSGLPVIDSAVTLSGNGATIRRDAAAEPFRILAVAATGDLTLTGTTLTGGLATYFDSIPYHFDPGDGGGILVYQYQGKLTVREGVIAGNEAYNDGGGVAVSGGTAIFERATVSDNDAGGHGGGISNGGEMTLSQSTVSNNESEVFGGGIGSTGTLTVVNSTVSGNEASYGGGLSIFAAASAHVIHSTLTGNRASSGGNGAHVSAARDFGRPYQCYYGVLTLERSIVSGNGGFYGSEAVAVVADSYCRGNVSTMGNLFGHDGDARLSGFTTGATDRVAAGALEEVLGPLGDNGGPTQTHALAENSPAIDAAPSAGCEAAPVGGIDQRGEPRPRDHDGIPTHSECDIGAFEAPGSDPQPPATFTISVPVILK